MESERVYESGKGQCLSIRYMDSIMLSADRPLKYSLRASGSRTVYPRPRGGSLEKRVVMTPKAKSLLVEIRKPFVAEKISAKAAHFGEGVRHQK